jgi:signal transduction histidine kinase
VTSTSPYAWRPGDAWLDARIETRPSPGTARAPATPAGAALARVYAVFPSAIRLSCGIAVAAVALVVRTPNVNVPLLAVVVAVLTVWAVVFYRRAVRRGASARLVLADLALTIACCLLMPYLVAPAVLPGGVSWIAVLASTSVIVCQFALPTWAGVTAGITVTAAYAYGAVAAGGPDEALAHAIILLLQTVFAAGLVYLTLRSSRAADRTFADFERTEKEAVIARAAREAERRQNRDLHDTVLSTLTIVGLGAVGPHSRALRARAAADLRALTDPARVTVADPYAPVALDGRLARVVDGVPIPVTESLEPCAVPLIAAEAIADSAAAALSNVARHAPGAPAWLRLHRAGATVVVDVIDAGPGFDPTGIPSHRYGIRESIVGRMATVGGTATIDAAPGRGARIRLEWTDGRRA